MDQNIVRENYAKDSEQKLVGNIIPDILHAEVGHPIFSHGDTEIPAKVPICIIIDFPEHCYSSLNLGSLEMILLVFTINYYYYSFMFWFVGELFQFYERLLQNNQCHQQFMQPIPLGSTSENSECQIPPADRAGAASGSTDDITISKTSREYDQVCKLWRRYLEEVFKLNKA